MACACLCSAALGFCTPALEYVYPAIGALWKGAAKTLILRKVLYSTVQHDAVVFCGDDFCFGVKPPTARWGRRNLLSLPEDLSLFRRIGLRKVSATDLFSLGGVLRTSLFYLHNMHIQGHLLSFTHYSWITRTMYHSSLQLSPCNTSNYSELITTSPTSLL